MARKEKRAPIVREAMRALKLSRRYRGRGRHPSKFSEDELEAAKLILGEAT